MDRGAWRAAVHGVAESRTLLSTEHTQPPQRTNPVVRDEFRIS